ncbi:hypothetical protein VNI00_006292 [Paramarasmius palmivorus]|uniref:Uncharacterized protein n=1 Tax=Paramarasmius palmivorus TaxID=297713 RepID=A0AAW0D7R5_9AGAR
MPRRKIYISKEQVKNANREKSAKYYQKHRSKILAKKQAERDEQRRQDDIKFIERMRRKRIRKWEDDQKDLRGPVDSCDPLSRIKALNHSLIRITQPQPSQYLDGVYHSYVRSCNTPRTTAPQLCPVENAITAINSVLRGADVFSNRILQSYGVTDHYRRASQFCKRLRWIVRCLEDMQYKFMDPDDDLEKAYADRRLSFQDPQTRDWIDGSASIPD